MGSVNLNWAYLKGYVCVFQTTSIYTAINSPIRSRDLVARSGPSCEKSSFTENSFVRISTVFLSNQSVLSNLGSGKVWQPKNKAKILKTKCFAKYLRMKISDCKVERRDYDNVAVTYIVKAIDYAEKWPKIWRTHNCLIFDKLVGIQ